MVAHNGAKASQLADHCSIARSLEKQSRQAEWNIERGPDGLPKNGIVAGHLYFHTVLACDQEKHWLQSTQPHQLIRALT